MVLLLLVFSVMLACGTALWTCRCLLCMHMLVILSIENMLMCFQCYSGTFYLQNTGHVLAKVFAAQLGMW